MDEELSILGLDLFSRRAGEMGFVSEMQKLLNMSIGWHYYLDLAWILHRIRRLPAGSLILDAGAGYGLAQLLLAELGYNVISVDYRPRRLLRTFRERYGSNLHFLNR